jgi:UDP-N-acetylglucosamine diphosphorylase/glucosamine-1-phosphate N-acetyltransferase
MHTYCIEVWPSGTATGFGPVTPGSNPGTSDYSSRGYDIEGIAAIVLAGGKGVRMKSDLPKVLHTLLGRPLISHVLDNLEKAGITNIHVVVGYRGELVIDATKDRANPVWQREQLGTGHAVMQAEAALEGFHGKVVVACGDVPLISAETFRTLIEESAREGVKAVVLTMALEQPAGYGRVVKDNAGRFERIVEEKDATQQEKLIREVNTGTYVFDGTYLFEGLRRINTDNAQGEYYLPDALRHIRDSGFMVKTVLMPDPVEGILQNEGNGIRHHGRQFVEGLFGNVKPGSVERNRRLSQYRPVKGGVEPF